MLTQHPSQLMNLQHFPIAQSTTQPQMTLTINDNFNPQQQPQQHLQPQQWHHQQPQQPQQLVSTVHEILI